jgi:hypothetical protein
MLKSGADTTRVAVAEFEVDPDVPVSVTVEVPTGVPEVVVTVIVELPDVVIEAGEKEAVAPEGNPLALNVTGPVNPPEAATFTVKVVLEARPTVSEPGVAATEKVGFGGLSGMICMPFTAARLYPLDAVLGIADRVNPETLGIVKTT